MTTDYPLCAADDPTFWPWLSSPAIAAWPDKEETVIVLPMAGLRLLVLPPLRFVFGADSGCCFALGAPAAHAQIAEVAASIVSSGFRKIVLCNASPWNEEVCAAASRDLRINLNAKVFRINLSALGLDFHPTRSPDRRLVQTAVTALTGRMPDAMPAEMEEAVEEWGSERVTPLKGTPVPLERARLEGLAALQEAATRLIGLLTEISGRAASAKPSAFAQPTADNSTSVFPSYRDRYLPAMTLRQIQGIRDKGRALVIVATGAIEQHGPHLPVAMDSLMEQAWLSMALARLPAKEPCYVAPAIMIGKSNEHTGFPGTLMVSKDTLRAKLLAVAFQVHAWGFRKLAVINTHGGNTAVVVTTLREIRSNPGLRAGLLRVDEDLGISAQEAAFGMHAGEVETSWMLAAAPSLVNPSLAVREFPGRLEDPAQVRPELAPATFGWVTSDLSSSGVMGDATSATREKGVRWLESRANALAGAIEELCR